MIMLCVYTPIILYYCKQFWRMKTNRPSFSKRYPKYALIHCLCILVHILIIRPLADIPYILRIKLFVNQDIECLIRIALYNTIHGLYIMALIRAWLLFVKYTRCVHMMTISWQQQLNKFNIEKYKFPWTIRYPLLRYFCYVLICDQFDVYII